MRAHCVAAVGHRCASWTHGCYLQYTAAGLPFAASCLVGVAIDRVAGRQGSTTLECGFGDPLIGRRVCGEIYDHSARVSLAGPSRISSAMLASLFPRLDTECLHLMALHEHERWIDCSSSQRKLFAVLVVCCRAMSIYPKLVNKCDGAADAWFSVISTGEADKRSSTSTMTWTHANNPNSMANEATDSNSILRRSSSPVMPYTTP